MMTATSEYLARLDVALRDVPHGIAAEVRAGIAEELSSLGPDAAEARIAQLGDPTVIAREAMDAGGYLPALPRTPAFPPAPDRVPVTRTRGFAVAAALTLSFGGFLVPAIGWFIGAVLVLMSGMWRTWEKLVAICIPLVLFGLLALFSRNLLTGPHALIVVAIVLVVPASGLWLLWLMRGRTAAS